MTSLRHNAADPDGRATNDVREPRDLYLDAARDCILDVGWRRTTLTEVARRAGVSRMTIYRTWPDMPTLLGDLMTREWGAVIDGQVIGQAGDGSGDGAGDGAGDVVERLVGGIVGAVRLLRANELFVRIVELDPELILTYLLSRRGRSQDHILELVAAAIAHGQGAGEIRGGDPVTMARAAVLAAHGFVLSVHTMVDDQVDEAALDEELATLLTRTLRP